MAARISDVLDFRAIGFSPELRLVPVVDGIARVNPIDRVNLSGFPRIEISADFIEAQLRSAMGGLSIYGFLAHELSHASQVGEGYWERYRSDESNVVLELHADYLAGWILGKERTYPYEATDIVYFANAIFGTGDYEFSNPKHHGLPSQREAVMLRGFQFGKASLNSNRLDAAERGMVEVQKRVRESALLLEQLRGGEAE